VSLIILHLRWDDVSPEQFDCLCQVIPPGSELPPGCCSSQVRHVGRALLATATWRDAESAEQHLAGLPALVAPARLAAPHLLAFSVPAGHGVDSTAPHVHQAMRQSSPTATPVPVRAQQTVTVRVAPVARPVAVPVP
jgi:hypothetical protein